MCKWFVLCLPHKHFKKARQKVEQDGQARSIKMSLHSVQYKLEVNNILPMRSAITECRVRYVAF